MATVSQLSSFPRKGLFHTLPALFNVQLWVHGVHTQYIADYSIYNFVIHKTKLIHYRNTV